MKIAATRNPVPPTFEPVTLTLTLETQEEVNAAFLIGDFHHSTARAATERPSCYIGAVPTYRVEAITRQFFNALRPLVVKS